ncbi:sensor histidine kinase [Nonomuraea gerenzanensis]|uniref:histidine kinase n=1 Tax=Nonomuraea gerenzanensis TaxID=93944 RepID=A0A1M4DWZ5_9ACTN|nr:histidine kinase [Nonomuraea gerenzanensis]UBU13415.1 histidine kinase [Nonomuraea gerenzanensis]SBO91076.1 two-component system sensor kinase [Nonomuraea gerenzanensis]
MLRRYGHVATLLALAIVQIPMIALTGLMLLLSFALGMVFLFPPQAMLVRRLAALNRRLVRDGAGVEIDSPYLPPPPPPVPQPDGMYRSDRTLYKTPRVPAWNNRWKWLVSDPATWRDHIWLLVDPLVKVALAPLLVLLPGRGLRAYGLWSKKLLDPTAASRLAGQVSHLRRTRNLAADSQAAEMRRIERDLHDGTQARLVAIGMTLGAVEELVESDPKAAKALLAKARDASSETLTELRRVIRGIHPPVLAERGLADAVRALAMDSPLDVTVEVNLPNRPEAPVEAAVYFAVSELLSNAARHGDARTATVDISANGASLRVTVTDDGLGGADPDKGSGLIGIERRLAAFDGVLALNSPPGGPTIVSMELPKVLPVPWAQDFSKMPRWKSVLIIVLWATAWCPTFPQGVVAAIFKIFGVEEKTWFLALHLPLPWQWPVILGMISLGVIMHVMAIRIPATHNREKFMAEATPTKPWC